MAPARPRPTGLTPGRWSDVVCVNYYARSHISGLDDATVAGAPVSDLGWEVYPEGLLESLRLAASLARPHGLPVWVTENGTADAADTFRARYLAEHLSMVARARTENIPVERFYQWSLTDNFEWDKGETPRFGLYAVDHETQERTLRRSGEFYANVARAGAITPELREYVAGQEYPVCTRTGVYR